MLKSVTYRLSSKREKKSNYYHQDVTKAVFLRITNGKMFSGIPNII